MSRRDQRRRVPVHLDTRGIQLLTYQEIATILRGADDLIMSGGRTLLVNVLKGSRAKEVIAHNLDQNPAYGAFRDRTKEEVAAMVDWMIVNDYLRIEYDGRLPLLVFTPRGWGIAKDVRSSEVLETIRQVLQSNRVPDMIFLKDRSREMIWLLLDKIEATGDPLFLPALEAWHQIDYKKVRQRIREVMERLSQTVPGAASTAVRS
jgi:hypothetical protein